MGETAPALAAINYVLFHFTRHKSILIRLCLRNLRARHLAVWKPQFGFIHHHGDAQFSP